MISLVLQEVMSFLQDFGAHSIQSLESPDTKVQGRKIQLRKKDCFPYFEAAMNFTLGGKGTSGKCSGTPLIIITSDSDTSDEEIDSDFSEGVEIFEKADVTESCEYVLQIGIESEEPHIRKEPPSGFSGVQHSCCVVNSLELSVSSNVIQRHNSAPDVVDLAELRDEGFLRTDEDKPKRRNSIAEIGRASCRERV